MNLSTSSSSANKDSKLSSSNKITLNPDAAEFIPFALRSTTPTTTKFSQLVKPDSPVSLGKSVLDKSESSVSNNSDDEIHQYWRCQLPDDITPDFKSISEEELHVPESLSMAALSMYDGAEVSRFSSGTLVRKNQEIDEQVIYSVPTYFEEQSGSSFMTMSTDHWDKQLRNGTHQLQEELSYKNDMSTDFINGVLPEHPSEDVNEGNPIEYLAPLFPGFAADSLAEVYYANQGDLNSTIEMLTQLELQFDGGFNQSLTSKTSAPPNLNSVEFPALPDPQNGLAKYCGDDIQQTSSAYQPLNGEFSFLNSNSPGISKGPIDFASAVRKLASQGSGKWQYEGNNSLDVSTGTSTRRSSLNLGNSYNGNTRSVHGEKLQNYAGVGRTAPVWLETGEAVANLYSELREEARDHARLRNAYLEQARQAYLIGNKALAKELSVKGQLHNMKMKAAHEQAKESIYRHRNPVAVNGQSHSRGQERMIDLHGLHVSEAIRVLKNEIGLLRTVSRSTGQRIQVLICVGTGHHTKGTRTPARLPVAVEQYLLEEGLHFSETLPGLLRVVIY